MLIICTQLYGFKYSYQILIIYIVISFQVFLSLITSPIVTPANTSYYLIVPVLINTVSVVTFKGRVFPEIHTLVVVMILLKRILNTCKKLWFFLLFSLFIPIRNLILETNSSQRVNWLSWRFIHQTTKDNNTSTFPFNKSWLKVTVPFHFSIK